MGPWGYQWIPLVTSHSELENDPIDLANMVIFHGYVKLPDGNQGEQLARYQLVLKHLLLMNGKIY